jgi:hypothetical protein
MDWDVRTEVLRLSHFWPLPFVIFLAGCLIGWGVGAVWPSPYRAETTLHVSYNGDSIFRNSDDYKNWQMEELNTLVLAKGTLQDTLSLLREQDPYWGGVSARQLESMLSVYWRNTGKWRLVAEAPRPNLATQLAETWGAVVVEKIQAAVGHANAMLELDRQVKAVTQAQTETNLRLVELTQVKLALQTWQEKAQAQDPQAAIHDLERWRLQGLVARLAALDPAGQALFEQTPPRGALLKDYLPWVGQALASADDHITAVQQQQNVLAPQPGNLYQRWNDEYKESHGITAYLMVEPLPNDEVAPRQVRPTQVSALVGGLLSLLAWSLVWLARPLLKARK